MNEKLHLLITGGTGFIGSNYIKRFQNKYQITVLTRQPDTANLPKSVALITSLNELENLDEFDAIINLQGEAIFGKRWSHQQKKELEDSRTFVTQTLSTLIQNSTNPPIVFISGSAIGFYGRQKNDKIVEEGSNEPFREFSHQLCKKWEKAALRAHKATRVCLLRTGIVLGINGGALSEMLPSFKLGLGAIIADGQQKMSWIHIDDVICAIDYIITHESLEGPINLTAPNPVSNEIFSKTLASALNKPCFIKLPEFVARIILGEACDLVCFGQHVIPKKLQEEGFEFYYPSIKEALSNLLTQ
ncbi:TIGR01777 family protein [Thalassotalea sp. M1531]|uniref:TIGR01777 family protein n=1 Tax=Thalassotalea algicola TaxID=2716224 RepID=A0A7Y0LFH9_9GAMM|nr:TIGR01777 family oxidoreductase [Thalassotalea algicola]NMP33506.1 TIGR01777 family protein [Thalassotalea algicola]